MDNSTYWLDTAAPAENGSSTGNQIRAAAPEHLFVYNEFAAYLVEGKRLVRIEVFDDGTHGDETAGDLIYSRSGINSTKSTPFAGGRLSNGHFLYGSRDGEVVGILWLSDVFQEVAELIRDAPPAKEG